MGRSEVGPCVREITRGMLLECPGDFLSLCFLVTPGQASFLPNPSKRGHSNSYSKLCDVPKSPPTPIVPSDVSSFSVYLLAFLVPQFVAPKFKILPG